MQEFLIKEQLRKDQHQYEMDNKVSLEFVHGLPVTQFTSQLKIILHTLGIDPLLIDKAVSMVGTYEFDFYWQDIIFKVEHYIPQEEEINYGVPWIEKLISKYYQKWVEAPLTGSTIKVEYLYPSKFGLKHKEKQ